MHLKVEGAPDVVEVVHCVNCCCEEVVHCEKVVHCCKKVVVVACRQSPHLVATTPPTV